MQQIPPEVAAALSKAELEEMERAIKISMEAE